MSRPAFIASLAALSLTACAVGPDYERPSAPVPQQYKELQGWKVAQPQDAKDRGPWWSVFADPTLDDLEKQVDISNQNIQAAAAAYLVTTAQVREARASLFPTLDLGVTGNRQGSNHTVTTNVGNNKVSSIGVSNSYEADINSSWDLDIWGKARRGEESAVANAQANAALLASARLSAQASLAVDYFSLRAADQLQKLLDDTVAAYQRSLSITQNQYSVGVASRLDVITAQTQLDTAESAAANVGVQRAIYEHAIAVLIGKAPADFSLPPADLTAAVPEVPVSLPSELLERRPDIAVSERQMAAANAEIGVEKASYYPDISLTGLLGFTNDAFAHLVSQSHRIWSLGAAADENLFAGGGQVAAVSAAEATYDENVADYRQSVLTAFQGVEDQLATLRILGKQAAIQDEAVKDATQAASIALNQYRAGTVAYTAVVTAQATQLSTEQQALNLQQSRLVATVTLIEDLGGGWSADQLPTASDVKDDRPSHP